MIDGIRTCVAAELEAFDRFIGERFTAEGELLSEMLRQALAARGKGIRPLLVMLSAALHARVEGASRGLRPCVAAMLVEMIHMASLIHDDVIDEADTRRGRPSARALWQSHKAVLLGDYVLARNLDIGLASGQIDLVAHVCGALTALCEGEVLQADCAERRTMTRRTYFDIVRRKTASLLGVSASVGALSVGASAEQVATMRRFGEAVGTAFQIRDDLLDYTPSARTGKPACNDLREGKITLPLLAVLEEASEELRAELLDRLDRCCTDEAQVEPLRAEVERAGGLAAATEAMRECTVRAAALLSDYPDSPYRSALIDLCAYIAERDR